MNLLLADIVLFIHFAFVLFVTGGLALIWVGAAAGWKWVRHFWFRVAHLAAIAFVAAEGVLGIWCPLTVWEARLRGDDSEKSFMAEWVHRLLYYDLPEWMFTVAYVLFGALVAATWHFVRPEKRY
ncbi:MAG TPA: DUF2784 domain-containing protein [Burkholderiales bacterium]|nr:DUF2784 domain-containing protein [Burkholderiales bacterium]